jgi:rhamnogalacturonan endolyase
MPVDLGPHRAGSPLEPMIPATAPNPVGQNNLLTISVSQPEGDEDDALRLELTNTSAAPSIRGWNDYTFVTTGASAPVTVPPNDAIPNP